MRFNNIEELLQNIGTAKYINKQILGLPEEGWFLIEISPTPHKDEALKIATDIHRNEIIDVKNGKLYHPTSCSSETHNLTKKWINAVENVKEETYKIGIYPGHKDLYNGQPIVVAIDPVINYIEFPDHPHISLGGYIEDKNIFMPDTLCYTHNPEELGNIIDYRVFEAYKKIAIWLYRHQIWLSMREQKGHGKGEWIGQGIGLDSKHYVVALDPLGECRYGRKRSYIDCHMVHDLSMNDSFTMDKAKAYTKANRTRTILDFSKKHIAPKKKAIELLRSELLG